MSTRSLSVVVGVLLLSAAGVTESHAVPSLGVGSSSGYINATDAYQKYWGSSQPGTGDGFVIGPSGSSLHVFTNILNSNIYILTTADVEAATGMKFNGTVTQYGDIDTFSSFSPTPYYGTNLGSVDTSTWTALPENPFTPGPFYSLDVLLSYSGTVSPNQWVFAAADNNGLAGLQAKTTRAFTDTNGITGIQTEGADYWVDNNGIIGIQEKDTKTGTPGHWVWIPADKEVEYAADTITTFRADDSSPKTTSATANPVPEPGSAVLLGAGLLGLAVYGKRRRNA